MAVMAVRPHTAMHFRIQAVGLEPRRYAALAARAHRAHRVQEALWSVATIGFAVAAVGVTFIAIGAPAWLAALICIAAFVPLVRALRSSHHHIGVVVERHARAA